MPGTEEMQTLNDIYIKNQSVCENHKCDHKLRDETVKHGGGSVTVGGCLLLPMILWSHVIWTVTLGEH